MKHSESERGDGGYTELSLSLLVSVEETGDRSASRSCVSVCVGDFLPAAEGKKLRCLMSRDDFGEFSSARSGVRKCD